MLFIFPLSLFHFSSTVITLQVHCQHLTSHGNTLQKIFFLKTNIYVNRTFVPSVWVWPVGALPPAFGPNVGSISLVTSCFSPATVANQISEVSFRLKTHQTELLEACPSFLEPLCQNFRELTLWGHNSETLRFFFLENSNCRFSPC